MLLSDDLKNSVLRAALSGKLSETKQTDSNVNEMLELVYKRKQELINAKVIKADKKWQPIEKDVIPFDIPETWKWVHLGEIVNFQGGYAFKSTRYVEKSDNQVIRLGNVKNDNLLLEAKPVFISDDDAIIAENFLIQENDILVSMTGTKRKKDYFYTVRIENKHLINRKLFLNQRVGCFRCYGCIDAEYLCVALKNIDIQNIIFEKETGSANQGNLGSEDIKEFVYIPLPPIEEQKRIVEKIKTVLAEIEEYSVMEAELEEISKNFPNDMKYAVYQSALLGNLTKQLDSDSDIRRFATDNDICIITNDENLSDIPESWIYTKLKDLVEIEIKRGKTPKYVEKSNVLVFAQKCNKKEGYISLEDAKYLDESLLKKYEPFNFLMKNDIVINSTGGGTLGRIGYIDESIIEDSLPIVPDTHITTIRLKNGISSKYIFAYLRFNQSYLESKGVGSTNQTELRPEVIEELIVPLPPIEEQQRIVDKLNQILPLCDDLKV